MGRTEAGIYQLDRHSQSARASPCRSWAEARSHPAAKQQSQNADPGLPRSAAQELLTTPAAGASGRTVLEQLREEGGLRLGGLLP